MKPNRSLRSFLALAGSSLLVASSVNATQFWDGGGGDADWNTAENWVDDTLPAFNTTAINFGSLNAAGTGFGNVTVPSQFTANNDLTPGSLIKTIFFGNNGQASRTDAYTLQGNSIVLGDVINNGIVTTALAGNAIVSSIEDVIELNMDLGTAGTHRQIQASSRHNLRIDGVISGGANVGLLLRTSDSKITVTNANNSYLGFTNIAEGLSTAAGLVEITSIADGGENSSIGASSNAAANLRFNSGFNDTSLTTLRYIGDTDASTDRLFTLYGNTAGTNSAIESSGEGTLSFTNTGAIASGHARGRNFYLGGTNTGDNTFAPTLSDFNVTELATFTKQGAGKWIITGDHSYTGATTVSEGTLLINGSTSTTSIVSVASGATLGGLGIVGGDATIAGNLSPGQSPGTLTFSNARTLNSGATYIFEAGDLVDVGGTLTLTNNWTLELGTGFQDGGSILLFTYGLDGGFDLDPTFNTDNLGFTPTGALTLTDNGSGSIFLNGVSAIPEPSVALLGALGMLALLRRRR